MKQIIKDIAKRLPGLNKVVADLKHLRENNVELKEKAESLIAELQNLKNALLHQEKEVKPKIYTPSSDDLTVKYFELDQIPARKK